MNLWWSYMWLIITVWPLYQLLILSSIHCTSGPFWHWLKTCLVALLVAMRSSNMPNILSIFQGIAKLSLLLPSFKPKPVHIRLNKHILFFCIEWHRKYGTESLFIYFQEPEPPQILAALGDVDSSLGGSAMLELKMRGYPRPNIKWTKDGKPVTAGDRHKFVNPDPETVALIISKVRISLDVDYSNGKWNITLQSISLRKWSTLYEKNRIHDSSARRDK